jgi:hypothetical protein
VTPGLADISERLWKRILSFRPIACVSVFSVTHPNIVASLVALTRVVSALPGNKAIVQMIALVHEGYRVMQRTLCSIANRLISTAFAICLLPAAANAQVMIDMGAFTCDQYLAMSGNVP